MGEGEQGSSEADGEGGDVMAEVEKERGEQGSKVKQREMIVVNLNVRPYKCGVISPRFVQISLTLFLMPFLFTILG